MIRTLLPLLLLACGTGSNKGGDSGAAPDGWTSLLTDHLAGGIVLSGWETPDDTLVMVGGNLRLDEGMVAIYDGETICTQVGVADGALWWVNGDDDGWTASGTRGVVLRDEGGVRTRMDVPTEATLFGVWIDGDTTWIAGGNTTTVTGEIWRKDGDADWEAVATDLPAGACFPQK